MRGSCRCKSARLMLAYVARAFQARVGGPKRAALHWICAIALSGLTLDASTDLPLIKAVKNKDLTTVRALLKQRVDVNATEGDGTTALHWASHRDDLGIADALIRSGAHANAANDLGATPLHLACTNRSAPMVERLLAAGGNPNASLLNGETVLMTCARAGDARSEERRVGKECSCRSSTDD